VTSSLKKLLADCFKTVADGPKTGLLAARAISNRHRTRRLEQWKIDPIVNVHVADENLEEELLVHQCFHHRFTSYVCITRLFEKL